MKRMLSALLALVLLAAPALAQGYKLDFIDEQGVYLEVLTTEWKEDKLRFDVVVENNTGREIDLRIEDAYAGSAEIDGVGIYDVEDGERDDDEFFFLQPLDGDSMAVLENADVLSFTIEVQDEESHDTLFAVPVTLNVVNFPAATPDFPTDAEPAYAPEVLLILPEGGYGEWQFVDGDMLRMRVTVENTGPTIDKDELPLLFDRFHKADKSRSADREGWGLGLYIAKTIVGAHGGDIWATSENGVTQFIFTLPTVR